MCVCVCVLGFIVVSFSLICARSIMAAILGNGSDNSSSNPEFGYSHFTS